MEAGKLRHKITIQSVTETRDAYGGISQSWGTYTQPWAAIEPLNGREFYEARQVNPELSVKVRVRYESGITPKMRVSYGSRIFNILSVVNIEERDIELVLLCAEQVTA